VGIYLGVEYADLFVVARGPNLAVDLGHGEHEGVDVDFPVDVELARIPHLELGITARPHVHRVPLHCSAFVE
jgi:hypothetical protein